MGTGINTLCSQALTNLKKIFKDLFGVTLSEAPSLPTRTGELSQLNKRVDPDRLRHWGLRKQKSVSVNRSQKAKTKGVPRVQRK